MCEPTGTVFDLLAEVLPSSTAALPEPSSPARQSSRRRRIWELGNRAHCPLVGVCVPVPMLERIALKVYGPDCFVDGYALHCQAVADCSMRTPMAEALQREIDRCCALEVAQATKIKAPELLEAWWDAKLAGTAVAGALWAVLTHPRVTAALTARVLGEIHMLQHQVGAAERADHRRLQQTLAENATLTGALDKARERITELGRRHAQSTERLNAEIVSLRARVTALTTAPVAMPCDDAPEHHPGTEAPARPAATRPPPESAENRRLRLRVERLQLELALTREQLHRLQRRRAAAAVPPPEWHDLPAPPPGSVPGTSTSPAGADLPAATAPEAATLPPLPTLRERAVLCVGGRPANVPAYRRLVEDHGARFLHHDGGTEESQARLDGTLAAADLVLCQTACVSHDAYWRVKEHCKRTGKPCVFVDSPSRTGLARVLRSLSAAPVEAIQAHGA